MKTWAIINQKGGVGKTTTAITLAGHMSKTNKRLLLVDLDPHGSLTSYMGYDPDDIDTGIYRLFSEPTENELDIEIELLMEGMLDALDVWAAEGGYDAMIFRVPVRYWSVRDLLLKRGFKISHSDVRMTCAGFPEMDRPGLIHLSKWE